MSTVIETFDLAQTPLRALNQHLHDLAGTSGGHVRVTNTSGAHAVACGIDAEIEVDVDGHVGYYCAGMNKLATVRVHGNAGSGLAENDDWVAMASEYRAIAVLPGADDARSWEPEPARVYVWEREPVA